MTTDAVAENLPPEKAAEKTPAFTEWQHLVAGRLGISEDELRQHRDRLLTKGVHWDKPGTRCYFSKEAVTLVQEALRISALTPSVEVFDAGGDGFAVELKKGADGLLARESALSDAVVTLKVWRAFPFIRNERLLEAYLPGTDPKNRANLLRVQVASNRNFIAGMEIPARLVKAPDFYALARRVPRSRGRW